MGERAINKKVLLIFAGLFGLILGGELLLPFFEELGFLAFEWAHKTLDVLFEDVFGLGDEASKKASAWTGLFLIIVLVVWGCYKLHQQYQCMKAAMSQWWAEGKAGMKTWWATLPWTQKLVFVLIVIVLVGILAMFI